VSYRELTPHPALRAHVDRFWIRTPEAPGARLEAEVAPVRILPDGCIDVLIDLPTGVARVVGAMTRAVSFDAESSRIAAVRFRPGGAAPFLRVTAAELTDRVVDSGQLGARWLDASGAGNDPAFSDPACDDPARAALRELERELLERVSSAALERGAQHATRRLLAARAPGIDALARELGHSRQHLARLFREHVGVSPKHFARVARLQRAIDHVQRAPRAGLAGAALDLGYYDQAHMARDFNDLAGMTPLAARRARGSVFPIRSLWLEA
jgi:AraC-like DNA-binding protein